MKKKEKFPALLNGNLFIRVFLSLISIAFIAQSISSFDPTSTCWLHNGSDSTCSSGKLLFISFEVYFMVMASSMTGAVSIEKRQIAER